MIRHLAGLITLLSVAVPLGHASAQILVGAEQPGPDCGG